MRKQTLKSMVSEGWLPVLMAFLFVLVVFLLLTFRLGTIMPAVINDELNAVPVPIMDVLSQPLYLHHQIIQKVAFAITDSLIFSVRAPSILVGVATAGAFCLIVRRWFTWRVAWLSVILFTTSAWFLHITRFGGVDSSFMLPLIPVAAGAYVHRGRYVTLGAYIITFALLAMLYVPGFIWFIVPLFVWQRHIVTSTIRYIKTKHLVALSALVAAGLLPLIVALVRSPDFILQLSGISIAADSVTGAPTRLVETVTGIFFYREEANQIYGIGHLPLVDVFTLILVTLGAFSLYHKRKLDRAKLIAALWLIGLLYGALGGNDAAALLLPVVYLTAAFGLALLLQQWFTVFPKNPLARQTGVIIIAVAVSASVLLSLTRYFIAWPNAPATAELLSTIDYS